MLNGTVITLNDVNVSVKPDEHSANYSKRVITLALKAGSRLFEISDGKAKKNNKESKLSSINSIWYWF
ncbi:hypothetical protein D6D54_00410 [Spiroplasma poulsonii]|uniref:Uncharacterized protein n=1 Tax=Spiroplasma poulsonii TaxID=2138 RepID=A0A433ESV6_9MOLU|nr:hypothetical protein [Spiroplasma poulsonii]MBW3057924.1 hypothetical protein [Spiroplasma poulsonii]RUP77996.1 hypothetical protein D6D54_00410 [Spiroplasma poulsonii]